MRQQLKAVVYSGLFNDLVDLPEFRSYLDPQWHPQFVAGGCVLEALSSLDLMRGIGESVQPNLAEPGMGYVSSHVFSFPQEESSAQLLLERLNDNGVGDNFRVSGQLPERAPHYEQVQPLLGGSQVLWYWRDRAYTHSPEPRGWQQATELPAELVAKLNESLGWLLLNGELQMVVHPE